MLWLCQLRHFGAKFPGPNVQCVGVSRWHLQHAILRPCSRSWLQQCPILVQIGPQWSAAGSTDHWSGCRTRPWVLAYHPTPTRKPLGSPLCCRALTCLHPGAAAWDGPGGLTWSPALLTLISHLSKCRLRGWCSLCLKGFGFHSGAQNLLVLLDGHCLPYPRPVMIQEYHSPGTALGRVEPFTAAHPFHSLGIAPWLQRCGVCSQAGMSRRTL